MTQAPTPGPLSGDDVNRECKACGAFKPDFNAACTFCGLAPTAPVEASGSELHHATADLVDRFAAELKSKLARAEAKYGYRDNWSRPGWEDELIESLVKHIQKGDPRDVAAYCAFAWHHGWSTSDAAGHLAPSHHLQPNREQIAKCIRRAVGDAWIGDAQAEVAAEAVLSLRPQPSGETREAVARLASLADDAEAMSLDIAMSNYVGTGAYLASDLRAILALLSARPLVLGGQHSGGEVGQ